MEASHEDKVTDSTQGLLKLRLNPHKMDAIRRLQGHFVNQKTLFCIKAAQLGDWGARPSVASPQSE